MHLYLPKSTTNLTTTQVTKYRSDERHPIPDNEEYYEEEDREAAKAFPKKNIICLENGQKNLHYQK